MDGSFQKGNWCVLILLFGKHTFADFALLISLKNDKIFFLEWNRIFENATLLTILFLSEDKNVLLSADRWFSILTEQNLF